MTGIAEVIQALTAPGSGVVINPPVYAPFFFRLELLGRRVVEAPLRPAADGGYDLDLAAHRRALAPAGCERLPAVQSAQPAGPGLVARRS